MRYLRLAASWSIASLVASAIGAQQALGDAAIVAAQDGLRIPSMRESAVLARRILTLTPLGTLSTVFPSTSPDHLEHADSAAPADLAGQAIGLMDYVADCSMADNGDPTILAINIATSFRNVAAGSNISLSLQWRPPHLPSRRITGFPYTWWRAASKSTLYDYSAANLPRYSLLGYLEDIPPQEVEDGQLARCFTRVHPDARYWLPGNSIHESTWMRLVVQRVYWIGGFGDRAYIGWIPVELWRNVNREEQEAVRLPGERKGWSEWAMDMVQA